MVKYNKEQQNKIFHALADSTRRQMLHMLAMRECTVSDLAQPFDISLAAVSKHLKVLEKADLVDRQIKGRVHYCKLNVTPLKEASALMNQLQDYWEAQLDALSNFLENNSSIHSNNQPKRKEK